MYTDKRDTEIRPYFPPYSAELDGDWHGYWLEDIKSKKRVVKINRPFGGLTCSSIPALKKYLESQGMVANGLAIYCRFRERYSRGLGHLEIVGVLRRCNNRHGESWYIDNDLTDIGQTVNNEVGQRAWFSRFSTRAVEYKEVE